MKKHLYFIATFVIILISLQTIKADCLDGWDGPSLEL